MSRQAGTTRRSALARVSAIVIGAAAVLAAAGSCSKSTAPGSGESAAPTETAAGTPAAPAAATPEAPATATATAPTAPAAPAAAAPAQIKGDRYTVNKDGTQVTLGITGNTGEIAFELVTQPSDPKCQLRLSGTAKEKGGDMETREDEQGEMIAVAEYVHESSKDCWVSISLEMDKRSMAWVSTADCPNVPESCWLNTFGPLRKQ